MPLPGFLLKTKCISCGRIAESGLCGGCLNQFQNLPPFICTICKSSKVENDTCLECLSRPPLFRNVTAIGVYSGLLKSIIYDFKYQGQKKFGAPLGKLLAEKVREDKINEIDYLTCIPLHKDKLQQRKFNQARIISVAASKSLKKPYRDLIIRKKNTQAQFSLSLHERKENLSSAFEINKKANIKGKKVLLIDDIFTTGSTVQEACKLLKEHGAEDVFIAVLARSLS